MQLPSAAASSSDSDDDDVIRAVKETLGVRTRKRRPKPVVEPVVLLPCDEASDSDSEGKLMIAESPVSPESPRRPQSDEEGDERLPESERRESRVTTEATTTTEAETLPKVINSSNSPQSPQSEGGALLVNTAWCRHCVTFHCFSEFDIDCKRKVCVQPVAKFGVLTYAWLSVWGQVIPSKEDKI